jgi:hypothetical protein
MRSLLQKHEIWVFFALIIVANTVFIFAIHEGHLPFKLYNTGRFLLLGAVLVAVVALSRGFGGVTSLLAPLTRWRVSPAWYLFAALWAVSLCSVFVIVHAAVTGSWPEAFAPGLETMLQPSVFRTVLIGALIGEIVWVSYAFARLAPQLGTIVTALVVGTVWTGWWVPIAIMNVGVIPDLPLVALWINMIGIALVCGIVYGHTRSGLLVLLLQFGVNSSIVVFPVSPSTGGISVYWAFSIAYLAAALLLLMLWPPRPTPAFGEKH